MQPRVETIGVVGLGYVGLPLARAFARVGPTIGFDVNVKRVRQLQDHYLTVTHNYTDLAACTFYVIAVSTPVDENNVPDLGPVKAASETVGRLLKRGDVVVYESTVYPGVTEEFCGPILEKASGLMRGDFKLGYSPERINPGDSEHALETVVKVVSGEDQETLDRVAAAYERVVRAGVYRATSIKVAEAAKVIENIQRDLNIALMNELSIIFDRLGIRTSDVLDAAGTKWNFLKFKPGLVGGHCIGVDPYYLTMKAQQLGYQPEVILAGRRINEGMGRHIALKTVQLMVSTDMPVRQARIGILGFTFKEDCEDIRNTKVFNIVSELEKFGIAPLVSDPIADPEEVMHEYGVQLTPIEEMGELDVLIVAVAHKVYRENPAQLLTMLRTGGVLVDVKSLFPPDVGRGIRSWGL
jgi:UDP-N-acetyl-D-galactosamine dehydrogenase